MKHLQDFKLFENQEKPVKLTKSQRDYLDKHTEGTWELNPVTGEVDIDGDFDCSHGRYKGLRGIQFGKVTGTFNCSYNNFTSLKGAPREAGDFYCSRNDNFIQDLTEGPRKVTGNYSVNRSRLQSLKGAPEIIPGSFNCEENFNLQTLKGGPKVVGDNFICSSTHISSLEGGPEEVGGDYKFIYCRYLKSLKGYPKTVGKKFVGGEEQLPWEKTISLEDGKWSIKNLVDILINGTGYQQSLLKAAFDPKHIQKEIDKNPEKMAFLLKSVRDLPLFKDLRFPDKVKSEADILANLDKVGQ